MSEVYADSIQAKVNGTAQAVPLRDSDAQEKIGSLSEDIDDFLNSGKMQYVDSSTVLNDTLWRNLPNGLTRAMNFTGFTTFSPFSLKRGTYYISKKIWHKYSWAKNGNGTISALNTIDNEDGDEYYGIINFQKMWKSILLLKRKIYLLWL